MNLTSAVAQKLDAQRVIKLGLTARLVMMNFAPIRGYDSAGEITAGWYVSDEDLGGGESVGSLKLRVAESVAVTAALLKDCAGFVLLRANEASGQARFCKAVTRKEPLDEMVRVWTFTLTPTKELIAI